MREETSRAVLVALYLRDALGVPDPSGLPRLLGTALPVAEPPPDEFAWWWTRWWVSIVEPDADGWGVPLRTVDDEGMVVVPESGADAYVAALRRHLDDARTWADLVHADETERALDRTRRGDPLVLAELVAEREADAGRAARPFRLRLEVLPLTVGSVWWIAEHAVAVDSQLRDDPLLFREAMRAIVAQLA